jgi:imidazoleglycerol-phosphate dehydratase
MAAPGGLGNAAPHTPASQGRAPSPSGALRRKGANRQQPQPEGEAMSARRAEITRATSETDIRVSLDLDGTGQATIATGVGFLDHMLTALARHALLDLAVQAKGDLHIDDHHTTEDVGIVIGQAIRQALGDKRGIRRYGAALIPMDEALAEAALDISGRPFLAWSVAFQRPKIGTFDTELVEEFFRALAFNAGITLHVTLKAGTNAHHVAEACFKALARALRQAVEPDPRAGGAIPSTKGAL